MDMIGTITLPEDEELTLSAEEKKVILELRKNKKLELETIKATSLIFKIAHQWLEYSLENGNPDLSYPTFSDGFAYDRRVEKSWRDQTICRRVFNRVEELLKLGPEIPTEIAKTLIRIEG